MNFQRLCFLAAGLGLFFATNTAEAQFELAPPLTATNHVFSLTSAQLHLQQNDIVIEVPVTQAEAVPVTYLPAAPQPMNPPSRRYHLWSILWGGGVAMLGVGGLIRFIEQFNSDGTYYGLGVLGLGGLMLVGGVIGHVMGGVRYRRRMREYQQGVVYLEGTTLHW